jgi:excisionase family DNA binding protein
MREASSLTGRGEYVIRKAMQANQLKSVKLGKRWMIKTEDLKQWANGSNVDYMQNEVEELKSKIEMLQRIIDSKDAHIHRLSAALNDRREWSDDE